MRVDRANLAWRALIALAEVVRLDEAGSMGATWSTRLVLAFLFSISDGARTPYDAFWRGLREVRRRDRPQDAYRRSTHLTSAASGIVRSLGPVPTAALLQAIGLYDGRMDRAAYEAELRLQIEHGRARAAATGLLR